MHPRLWRCCEKNLQFFICLDTESWLKKKILVENDIFKESNDRNDIKSQLK